MNDKLNWKSIFAGSVTLIVGILSIILDLHAFHTETNLWISIGCSLIASGLVIILSDVFVDRVKENPLDVWGISRIYQSRTLMNEDAGKSMKKAKYQVDIVAFGLKSFRNEAGSIAEAMLKKGVNIRIITMNPDSEFVHQREREEDVQQGHIEHTIRQLIEWADQLNSKNFAGKVTIKGYSCMTLDFYWRVDDEVYIGPYLYGYESQKTISYKFSSGRGFNHYTEYFDKLWSNEQIMTVLTKSIKTNSNAKRRK